MPPFFWNAPKDTVAPKKKALFSRQRSLNRVSRSDPQDAGNDENDTDVKFSALRYAIPPASCRRCCQNTVAVEIPYWCPPLADVLSGCNEDTVAVEGTVKKILSFRVEMWNLFLGLL